mgnify:CR=1 FL=1
MEGEGALEGFHIRKYHATYMDSFFVAFMNQVSHSRGKLSTLFYKIIHKVSGVFIQNAIYMYVHHALTTTCDHNKPLWLLKIIIVFENMSMYSCDSHHLVFKVNI